MRNVGDLPEGVTPTYVGGGEITITLKYGSDFQSDVWHDMIRNVLQAIKQQMESKHKKNSMEVTGSDFLVTK